MNFPFTTLEPGMVPGPGLSATQTFLYFVVAPIALFVVTGLIGVVTDTKRDKRKSVVDQID